MFGCVGVNSRRAVVTASCPGPRAAAGVVSGTLKVRTARAGARDGRVVSPLQQLAQDREVANGNAEG